MESSKDVPPSTKVEQEPTDEILAEFVKDLDGLADKDKRHASEFAERLSEEHRRSFVDP